ncbi:hypothetical protein AZA_02931 [Nitrospirillum viridazoti Y2]|nr:hypothetical protein AZA_02931 [Nitrospirillum amazonense Y2]
MPLRRQLTTQVMRPAARLHRHHTARPLPSKADNALTLSAGGEARPGRQRSARQRCRNSCQGRSQEQRYPSVRSSPSREDQRS